MSLNPITRQQLLDMKAKKEEDERIFRLNELIKMIYEHCLHVANKTSETYYHYPIPRYIKNFESPDPFYIKNMDTIIDNLKKLFPDSIVKHALMAKDKNNTLYDISNIDNKTLAIIDVALNESYIIIDWT